MMPYQYQQIFLMIFKKSTKKTSKHKTKLQKKKFAIDWTKIPDSK